MKMLFFLTQHEQYNIYYNLKKYVQTYIIINIFMVYEKYIIILKRSHTMVHISNPFLKQKTIIDFRFIFILNIILHTNYYKQYWKVFFKTKLIYA